MSFAGRGSFDRVLSHIPQVPPLVVGSQSVAPLFFSDWANAAIGVAQADIKDGNKWPNLDDGGAGTNISVVNLPAGFPAALTKGLKVNPRLGADVSILPADNKWSAPSIGGSLYMRFYLQVAIADAVGDLTGEINANHHTQCGTGAASDLWAHNYSAKNNGTFRYEFHTFGNPTPAAHDGWLLVNGGTGFLNKSTVGNACYRIENRYLRTAVNTYTIDMRIYDNNNVLLYNGSGVGASIGAIYQAGDPGVTMAVDGVGRSLDDTLIKGYLLGSNGSINPIGDNEAYYYGGLCIRGDDWCGPYTAANK